jgi:hypothetical protein
MLYGDMLYSVLLFAKFGDEDQKMKNTTSFAIVSAISASLFYGFGVYIGLIFGTAPASFSWGTTGLTLVAVLNLLVKIFPPRPVPRKMTPEMERLNTIRNQLATSSAVVHHANLIIEDMHVLVPLQTLANAGDAEAASHLALTKAALAFARDTVKVFDETVRLRNTPIDHSAVVDRLEKLSLALKNWRKCRTFLVEKGVSIGPSSSFWG